MFRSSSFVLAAAAAACAALLASGSASASTSGLAAAYNFDEAAGTTALDTSPNGNTGTIAGATRSAAGHSGGALSFDGFNDQVNVADADSLDLSSAMTLEAWVRPSAAGGWRTVVLKERPAGLAYALYSDTDTNRPSGHAFTSAEHDTRGIAQVPVNAWTHLATTYDGSAIRLFVNGTQVSSQAVSGAMTLSGGALRIGGNAIWGEFFSGLIDDVRVYGRALTATEIQADLNTPVSDADTQPPTAPTGLSAAVSDSRRVTLNWTAATDEGGVASYQIHRSTVANFTPSAGTLITTTTATTFSQLVSAAGTYHYRVIAVDQAGNAGAPSDAASAVVAPDTAVPTIAWLSPAAGADLTNIVTLRAGGDDDWGSIESWQFQVDGGTPVDATSGNYVWDTRTVAPGPHTVVAIGRDAAGNAGQSAPRTFNVYRQQTSIAVTTPATGATVSGTVTLKADAASAVGITSVAFSVGQNDFGSIVGSDGTAPYETTWDTTQFANGTYQIQAMLNESGGDLWQSAKINVTVANAIGTPGTPTGLTATVTGDDVHLAWNAPTFANTYYVYRGTTATFSASSANRIATVSDPSYDDLNRPTGTSYYKVIAVNLYGLTGPTSTAVQAIVSPPDTTPPSVSISGACDGATVSGTVQVSAVASDDRGVASVQFRLDGEDLGALRTTAPFRVDWDTTGATTGPHTLTAIARDAAGNTTTSPACPLTVDNGVVTPPSQPIAAYGFEETSGTSALDATGHGYAGAISGATRTTAGKFGRALTFDGSNDLVEIADAPAFDLGQAMTLEAWVRPSDVSGWRTALMKQDGNGLLYALYASTDTGRPSGHVTTSGEVDTRGTAALAVNTWTHVATTYDGTYLRLFINGTQVSQRAITGAMPVSAGPLTIGGNRVWSEWFKGQIDEVRVYHQALSALDIQGDMNRAVS